MTIQFRASQENNYGTCWNLALQGMYIVFDGNIVPGESIEMSFIISEEYPLLIEAQGKVIWVNIGNNRKQPDIPEGFGIEFMKLGEEARLAISKFVEQE
jgi:PilZ domain